ncbi:MAG: DUF600 family protein [Clostridia bacterium]
MNSEIFQKVFDKLQNKIEREWHELIFCAFYFEGSYRMKYYLGNSNNEYIDCFSLDEISDSVIIKQFMDIDHILLKERDNLLGDDKWTAFTMIVDNLGAMKVEFAYDDFAENSFEYEREWQKKYLNN